MTIGKIYEYVINKQPIKRPTLWQIIINRIVTLFRKDSYNAKPKTYKAKEKT